MAGKQNLLAICFVTLALFGTTAATSASNSLISRMLTMMRGTTNIAAEPYMREGRLTGCTLAFESIYQDWGYRQGGFLKVSGNVGIMDVNGFIGANLKVVVLELDPNHPTLGLRPSPPSRTYLIANDLSTNLASLKAATPSDTPGAIFSIFELSPTIEIIMEALERNELLLAFNSQGGETDLQMKLELDVIDVSQTGERNRSPQMKMGFLECLRLLSGSASTE